jgi:arylsulfatase A-like enzyme
MSQGPNVIVLIFDTLRSDYISPYDTDIVTPAFRTAAEIGTVFESAFAAAPGTPVSHASIYTGKYPSEHGVTGQYIDLPKDVPVLAEEFSEAGYDTFGVTGPSKMGSDWQYDRGFDELFEPYHDMPPADSLASLRTAVEDEMFRRYLIRKITKGGSERTRYKFDLIQNRIRSDVEQPFFILSNFVTVHSAYDPPRPYKEDINSVFSRPRLQIVETLLDDHGEIDDQDIRSERVMNMEWSEGIGRYLADTSYLNDREIGLLRDWYRASVQYLDDEFGRFLDFYRKELIDDTVLVLTADHGEQLGEHGLWAHSYYLYDETLKIPLIIVGPEVPSGARRSDLASHVDLFGTLCNICGVETPQSMSGASLFAEYDRDAVFMEYGQRDTKKFSKTSHGEYLDDKQLRAICAGRKAIRTEDFRFEITSHGTEHLYSLPEQIDVTGQHPDLTASLKARLVETVGDDFGTWPEGNPEELQIGEQVQRNLRELGYIE